MDWVAREAAMKINYQEFFRLRRAGVRGWVVIQRGKLMGNDSTEEGAFIKAGLNPEYRYEDCLVVRVAK